MADHIKNLPSNHLPPALADRFKVTIHGAVSLTEAKRLSTLPAPAIRKEIVTLQLKLGAPLTPDDCDAGLLMLAMAGLPRSSVEDEDFENVRALYFDLLCKAGVTGAMLRTACERYIMRPNNGKTKYFPDPGQLLEMVAEDARDRKRELERLNGALALLGAPPPPPEPEYIDASRMHEARVRIQQLAREKTSGGNAQPRAAGGRDNYRPGATIDQILASRNPEAVERMRALMARQSEEQKS